MRTIMVTLDATDTAKSIDYLAGAAGAVNGWADGSADGVKARAWAWFRIIPEAGNNNGASGPARITFEKTVTQASFVGSRTTPVGQRLLPGIAIDFLPSGIGALYNANSISITGQSGDVFCIQIATA